MLPEGHIVCVGGRDSGAAYPGRTTFPLQAKIHALPASGSYEDPHRTEHLSGGDRIASGYSLFSVPGAPGFDDAFEDLMDLFGHVLPGPHASVRGDLMAIPWTAQCSDNRIRQGALIAVRYDESQRV